MSGKDESSVARRALQDNTSALRPQTTTVALSVVTDLTVCTISPTDSPSTCELDPRIWHRIEKKLYLYTSWQSAWLYLALASEKGLTTEDLLVMDIRVGEQPLTCRLGHSWESRPEGIWVLRSKFAGKVDRIIGMAQMSILQDLPFSLFESGPEQVECVGNFYLQVLAPAPSLLLLSTLYFLDSHGQISTKLQLPDYAPIKQSQID